MLTDYEIISWKKSRMKAKLQIADMLLNECNVLQAEIDFFEAVNPRATLDQYPVWLQESILAHGCR